MRWEWFVIEAQSILQVEWKQQYNEQKQEMEWTGGISRISAEESKILKHNTIKMS